MGCRADWVGAVARRVDEVVMVREEGRKEDLRRLRGCWRRKGRKRGGVSMVDGGGCAGASDEMS